MYLDRRASGNYLVMKIMLALTLVISIALPAESLADAGVWRKCVLDLKKRRPVSDARRASSEPRPRLLTYRGSGDGYRLFAPGVAKCEPISVFTGSSVGYVGKVGRSFGSDAISYERLRCSEAEYQYSLTFNQELMRIRPIAVKNSCKVPS